MEYKLERNLLRFDSNGKVNAVRRDYYNFLLFTLFYCFKCAKPFATSHIPVYSDHRHRKCDTCNSYSIIDKDANSRDFVNLAANEKLLTAEEINVLIPLEKTVFKKIYYDMIYFLRER